MWLVVSRFKTDEGLHTKSDIFHSLEEAQKDYAFTLRFMQENDIDGRVFLTQVIEFQSAFFQE